MATHQPGNKDFKAGLTQSTNALTIGLDFGTNSVRALLVDAQSGGEVATSVFNYPTGQNGILLSEKELLLARQNPADYIEGFVTAVRKVLIGVDPKRVKGIGIAATGSSPMPISRDGSPVCFDPKFKDNLAANVWIWKDHTSHDEALAITEKAQSLRRPYTAKCGGIYSSEWFWSKIWHCANTAPEVFEASYSWAEISDWIPAWITGNAAPDEMKHSVCAAGHKAMYAEEWGGLPSRDFLQSLDPRLADLRSHLYDDAFTCNKIAGTLTKEFAEKTGLGEGTPVAIGGIDAHFGAIGSGVAPGVLVKIMGTSTCDCMVHPLSDPLPDIPGLCGIVKESILPGYYGLEAGQSAVGDIFNWFSKFVGISHEKLTLGAEHISAGQSGLVALDWHNGNRTVLVDPLLTGLIVGETLNTTPFEMYRAYIEATAFGSLRIINRMEEYGVKVDKVVACGGIAEKSPLAMQIYADVFNRPVWVAGSSQTCALGAAIVGAVAGGIFKTVQEAQKSMAPQPRKVYEPNPNEAAIYKRLYQIYLNLHDCFGGISNMNLGQVMKDLIQIRNEVSGNRKN